MASLALVALPSSSITLAVVLETDNADRRGTAILDDTGIWFASCLSRQVFGNRLGQGVCGEKGTVLALVG